MASKVTSIGQGTSVQTRASNKRQLEAKTAQVASGSIAAVVQDQQSAVHKQARSIIDKRVAELRIQLPQVQMLQYICGKIYQGEVKDGLPHGQGRFIYSDKKSWYIGHVQKGMKHGYGTFVDANGLLP